MRMTRPLAAGFLVAAALVPGSLGAQERIDMASIEKIKAEGFQRSQVMTLAS